MDYASKELCQELYETTGWETDFVTIIVNRGQPSEYLRIYELEADEKLEDVGADSYAYTIGYLLDKLPNFHEYWNGGNEAGYLTLKHWSRDYESGYWEENGDASHTNKLTGGYAPTAADALAKLALELKKQGLI